MPIIIDGAISIGPGISVNYVTPPPAGWNVSNSSYVGSLTLTRTGDFYDGYSIHFKPDGTKMFIGAQYRSMGEYTLSTPWDISTATRTAYRTGFGDASPIYTEPRSIALSSDGTKIYHITPNGSNAVIRQAPLNTAWNLSSLPGRYDPYGIAGTPGPISYTISSGVVNGGSKMEFSADGSMLFVVGSYTAARIDKFTLSTPWDITTLTYVGYAIPVTPTSTDITSLAFKPDGTKMILHCNAGTGTTIREYDLSTPWDITTSTYVRNLSITVNAANLLDVYFKPDGSGYYFVSFDPDAGLVYQYNISS